MLTFLKTLPGTLTGLAAVIVAVTGLVTAYKQLQPPHQPGGGPAAVGPPSQQADSPKPPAVSPDAGATDNRIPQASPEPPGGVTSQRSRLQAEPAPVAPPKPEPPPPPVERTVALQLRRILVTHDGGSGSARWSFVVRANGVNVLHSVASLANTETRYEDRSGKNTVDFGEQATDSITVKEGSSLRLEVVGTRTSEPTTVTGVTDIAWDRVRRAADGDSTDVPVTSVASLPTEGSFIFTFGLRREP